MHPLTSLFLAWQDTEGSRAWFPIGRLDANVERSRIEINSPTTQLALQLQSEDYLMLGWAPRYLVDDLVKVIAQSPGRISARVVRVNPPPAPANQRVLVELTGSLPADYEPMSGPDFQL